MTLQKVLVTLFVGLSLLHNVCADHVKHITLVVTQELISPACSPRWSLVVNGTYPGPELHVNGGDHVHIRVWNEAPSENLTMHWHGISQYGSPFSDGTPSASQWPIPPGKYFDYEFMFADDLDGTFWYHSHVGFSALTVHGAIIVHEKGHNKSDTNTPIPYDEERVVLIHDLFNKNDADLVSQAITGSFIGGANEILINGHNYAVCNQTFLDTLGYNTTCDLDCSYASIPMEPDKTYLFRFVAASVDTFAGIAFQDHNMTIVQVDGGSWIEPFETNYIEIHSGQRVAVIVKAKSLQELQESGKLTYWVATADYQNPPNGNATFGAPFTVLDGGPNANANANTNTSSSSSSSSVSSSSTSSSPSASASANTTTTNNGKFVKPISPPPPLYALLTYSYPGSPEINQSIYQNTPPATETMPFLPNYTIGPQYGNLVSDKFKPLNPIKPPESDFQVKLTTSQDSWGGDERDTINGLGFFPDDAWVPLLVGMYNGQIVVNETSIARARLNNGFDNSTGAILMGLNETVDFIFVNQIGSLGLSSPHPFHLHGGDFWDMGGGQGEYTYEAWQEHLATITPVRRDTTVLGAGNATYYTPIAWRVIRWKPQNPGVWMLHCHIAGHMVLGLQTMVVVGTNKDLPPLPPDYQGAYLSKGQWLAMGTHDNETDFIPYFLTANSPPPTSIAKRWWNSFTWF